MNMYNYVFSYVCLRWKDDYRTFIQVLVSMSMFRNIAVQM